MYDITIIGAGIIGTFIARELSRYKINILLIDKENDISNGTTKANTALIHAGYDSRTDTNMAYFNVKGNPMFDKVCEELDVPFKRIGSLVLAFNDDDSKSIEELYSRGLANGVPGLKILNKIQVNKLEANIGEDVVSALYAKTAGIIGPWELAIALAENAIDNGVELQLNRHVLSIEKIHDYYKIETNKGDINSRLVINCAGVHADELNNMVSNIKFQITPKKGQYYLMDKSLDGLVNSITFQCPTAHGKGVVVAPTVHGNLIIGPDNETTQDKDDKTTNADNLKYIREMADKSICGIPFNKVITTFAGVRAESSTRDFIIGEASDSKGFINVAGIKSPGLSASPAIAEHVVNIVNDILNDLEEKKDYNPIRKKSINFVDLSDDEKNHLIQKDSRYGNIVCRCETITEGEIVDAIHRNAGGLTIDGIKRRIRPGSGRCQGGFCLPKVTEILARELSIGMEEVVKDGLSSHILTGKTK